MNQKVRKAASSFVQKNPQGVIILRGATATGKTSLSLEFAREYGNIEVISADSRQIYKYMDIGTDKIDSTYRQEFSHHMIDIVSPDETYTAGQWKENVEKLISEIHQRGNMPVIAGGTGLYIDMIYKNFAMPDVAPDLEWRAMMEKKEANAPGFLYDELQKVDPNEAMKHHPNSLRYLLRALEIYTKTGIPKSELAKELPVKWPLLMIGLWREKEDTNRRINARVKQMLADGALVDENKKLLQMGYTLEHTAMNGIGYKEVVKYIQGEYDLEKCEELLKRHTHRYAKRQRSWFRRYIMDMKARPKENVKYLVVELGD